MREVSSFRQDADIWCGDSVEDSSGLSYSLQEE